MTKESLPLSNDIVPFPHLCALRALSLTLIPERPGSAAGILSRDRRDSLLTILGRLIGAPSTGTREGATIAIQALISCEPTMDHVTESARIPLLSLWALLPPDVVVMVSMSMTRIK
jgi:hypothetical protein